MKISTATRMLQKYYAEAMRMKEIKDPVAWALYQTWIQANIDRAKKEQEERGKCLEK